MKPVRTVIVSSLIRQLTPDNSPRPLSTLVNVANALIARSTDWHPIDQLGCGLKQPDRWKMVLLRLHQNTLDLSVTMRRSVMETDARRRCFLLTCEDSIPESFVAPVVGLQIEEVVAPLMPKPDQAHIITSVEFRGQADTVIKVKAPYFRLSLPLKA